MAEIEKRIAGSSEHHKLVSIPNLFKNDSQMTLIFFPFQIVILSRSVDKTLKHSVYRIMENFFDVEVASELSVTGKSNGRGIFKIN